MINLNKANGELTVDNYHFSASTSYFEVEELEKELQIETRITNAGSRFYILMNINNGENKVMFIFYQEKLWINIFVGKNYNFPSFTITENETNIIRKLLADLGGEKTYKWGSLEFNEDVKAGTVSVLIKYK